MLRFDLLNRFGGIYLDVDVELLKPIDEFLNNFCFTGFEDSNLVNPGLIIGSEPNNKDFQNILDEYSKRHFFKNGKLDTTTICETCTKYYEQKGLERKNKKQEVNGLVAYPSEYFSPINIVSNKKKFTENTHTIHWYNASWYSPWQKTKKVIKNILNVLTFGLFGKLLLKIRKRKWAI